MSDLNVFKQPKPFYMIFVIELWERFGYYGLQAVLALFFVKSMGMSDAESFIVFGAFSALVYGLVAIGGFIGDKVLGTKRTMLIGAVTLTVGYALMGLAEDNHSIIYLALGAVAVGNGLFKANPSSLLAKCYEEGDARLHGAFTMYYMSINIGSFISMLLVPVLADHYGWHVGFYTCAIGMIVALASYAMQRRTVLHIGSAPDLQPVHMGKLITVIAATVVTTFIAAWLLKHLTVARAVLAIVSLGIVVIFLKEIFKSKGAERSKMIVALILMVEAILFFVLYMQMPTSLNFFAINNVEHSIFGIAINPVSFQSLNPFWIVIASPIMAVIYNHFGNKGSDLSMPGKFALGMLCCAISFLILPLAASFANAEGIISSNWLILSYGFQSFGELLISGLGLAMVAQLVPARLHGFIMGAWFLTTAAASFVGGSVATLTAVPATTETVSSLETLSIYSSFFTQLGVAALVIAVLMALTAPKLSRMSEAEDEVANLKSNPAHS